MSCCTIKKETSLKYLDILNRNFDEVLIEKKEKYQLLTLQDKAKKPNYDYIVWLQVKVTYDKTNSCNHTSQSKLDGAMEQICDWIDILKNFEKSNEGKQLSLFENENQVVLEKEPTMPKDNDESWDKYFKDSYRIKKNNLMKQYSFFELFDYVGKWWNYQDVDFTFLLPQSNSEMIELSKKFITGDIENTVISPTSGDFKDEYNYITRDGALSDFELYKRVLSQLRFDLVPYVSYFHVTTDNSYSKWESKEQIMARFWFSGRDMNGSNWVNQDLPIYDLNDPDFILWCREYFNVPYKEVISDEDILRKNIEHYIKRLIGSDNAIEYDFKNKINTFQDWKQFKADIKSYIPIGNNGGGSGYSLDGLDGSLSIDRKGNIKITQNYDQRVELNRSVDGLETDEINDVIIFNISGDEIYKKAFDLFSKKAVIQTSLFDFLAA